MLITSSPLVESTWIQHDFGSRSGTLCSKRACRFPSENTGMYVGRHIWQLPDLMAKVTLRSLNMPWRAAWEMGREGRRLRFTPGLTLDGGSMDWKEAGLPGDNVAKCVCLSAEERLPSILHSNSWWMEDGFITAQRAWGFKVKEWGQGCNWALRLNYISVFTFPSDLITTVWLIWFGLKVHSYDHVGHSTHKHEINKCKIHLSSIC